MSPRRMVAIGLAFAVVQALHGPIKAMTDPALITVHNREEAHTCLCCSA
jgi:hypothetical protein